MEATLKRRIAIGAAGLALLGAAGGTYAATRGSGNDERRAFLSDVARRLGVSRDDLESALRGAFFDRLDAAVAAGRITRAEADALKRRVRQHGGVPPFFGGARFVHPGPGGPLMGVIGAAASYLDLSRAQLRDRLESGKSLAQVARDRRRSVDGLKEAIEDRVRARLDAAVREERLTESQRREILGRLDRRIDDIVRRRGPFPRLHRAPFRGHSGLPDLGGPPPMGPPPGLPGGP